LVGSALVRELIDEGHEVRVLTRDPERAAVTLPVRCRSVRWDPEQGLAPSETLADADAVVHLAGAGVADRRWSRARKQAILRSRVGGGEALVRAIARLDAGRRPRVLVSASAVGFYGDRGDEVVGEHASRGSGFLADVCRAWEDAAGAASVHGVRVVTLRFGVVLARGGGALQRMLLPFRLGAGGRLGNGRQWTSWIHIVDLVRLIRFAIERDELRGAVNAVAPSPVTNATFTRALGRALGRPTLLPVPAFALRLALGELASMLLTGQRVVPEAATAAGFAWRYPDVGEALAQLCADLSHVLEREQLVFAPIDDVFVFFSDAYNLEKLTPAYLRFHVLGLDSERLAEGTHIDYRLRLRGIPLRWRTRIVRWNPPHEFVDVQLRGPYALWHHAHTFEPCAEGTLMRDVVHYRLPFGVLGELVGGALVRRDVDRIFDYRREMIVGLFPSATADGEDD